jgi:DNA-binding MarR family transcriptional regulator
VPKRHDPTQRHDRRIENTIKDEIRVDLLRVLSERSATPRELAEILEADPSDVLQHVVELWAESCIEVVADEGGSDDPAERRYRRIEPFFVEDRETEDLSRSDRERLSALVLQAIISEAVGALRTGSMDSRSDIHLSCKPLKLDERGWREVMALLLRTLKEAETIEEGCRERLGLAGEEGFEGMIGLLGFERSKSRAA